MKTVLTLVLGALVLVSCAPPPPDVTAVRKTIEAMVDKAEKDIMAGTPDTTMEIYTDDAISMPNNGPLLKGKQAIKEYYRKSMEMGWKFLKVNFVTIDVQVGGLYAYELGTYSMTMEKEGIPAMTDEGKYVTIWELGKDGKWRTKVETWNTNTEMPMPTPPEPEKGKK